MWSVSHSHLIIYTYEHMFTGVAAPSTQGGSGTHRFENFHRYILSNEVKNQQKYTDYDALITHEGSCHIH